MVEYPQYAWFVAIVWPDDRGAPKARIHEWDRENGQLGTVVEVVPFGTSRPFRQEMEKRYYEVVDGQLTDPVTPDGVMIALRRAKEPVPVRVPAARPVRA
jgi:hypothetical protein